MSSVRKPLAIHALTAQCLGSLMGLMLSVSGAWASLVTFEFSGTLDTAGATLSGLNPSLSVGQSFSGSYTFESTTPDSQAPAHTGFYQPGPIFSVTIGGLNFSSSGGPLLKGILVVNDLSGVDSYAAGGSITAQAVLAAFEASVWGIQLTDFTGSALSSDALPLTPPPLNAFGTNVFQLNFLPTGDADPALVSGPLSTLTLAPVPEPSTYTMTLAGLGLLGFIARRRMM